MIKSDHTKQNKIGGIPVFTEHEAVNAYKKFAKRVYSNLTHETSIALSDEAEKMHRIGFSWELIETLEEEAIAEL